LLSIGINSRRPVCWATSPDFFAIFSGDYTSDVKGLSIKRRVIVVSHVPGEISLEDRRLVAEQGAVIELVYRPGQDAKPLIEAARGVGVQHCATTVDGGQAFGPVPAEAFRAFVG
jgi:shikimate 5-dehydrogenase